MTPGFRTKPLPNNEEAEAAFLGAAMENKKIIQNTNLEAKDFYQNKNQEVFQALRWLLKNQGEYDIVSLADYLGKENKLERIGGRTYLAHLVNGATPSPLLQERIIKQKAAMRDLILASQKIEAAAYAEDEHALVTARNVLESLNEIQTVDDEIKLISEIAANHQNIITERFPTGISMIDQSSRGGLKSGDYVIVAGLPGHGKTLFCQNLCFHFSTQGLPVLYFSYEVQLPFLWEKFREMGINEDCFLYAPFQNITGRIEWIEKKVREAKAKYFIKMVVIDDISYITPKMTETNMSRNLSAYVEQISKELKTIAIREGIIIVTPTPLRKTEEPSINDIKESSGHAHKADVVIAINRMMNEDDQVGDYYSPVSEIVILKQRETGITARAFYRAENSKFYEDFSYRKTKRRSKF